MPKKIQKQLTMWELSIDGTEEIHDRFQRVKGLFRESINAIKLLNSFGSNKIGIRFTLTKETYSSLKFIFELAERQNIPKIYISHLVYSGRGFDNLNMDINKEQRLKAVNYIQIRRLSIMIPKGVLKQLQEIWRWTQSYSQIDSPRDIQI